MYENKRPDCRGGNVGFKEPRDPRRAVEFMDFIKVNEDHREQANLHQNVIMRGVAERFKVYDE